MLIVFGGASIWSCWILKVRLSEPAEFVSVNRNRAVLLLELVLVVDARISIRSSVSE